MKREQFLTSKKVGIYYFDFFEYLPQNLDTKGVKCKSRARIHVFTFKQLVRGYILTLKKLYFMKVGVNFGDPGKPRGQIYGRVWGYCEPYAVH